MVNTQKAEEKSKKNQLLSKTEGLFSRRSDVFHEFQGKTPEQIVHELQVYQIDLELQNEELRKAHQDNTSSRDRYQDQNEFAPVRYFSLTKVAVIPGVNRTGAGMPGGEKMDLLPHRFMKGIAAYDQDRWLTDFFFPLQNNPRGKTSEENITPIVSAYSSKMTDYGSPPVWMMEKDRGLRFLCGQENSGENPDDSMSRGMVSDHP